MFLRHHYILFLILSFLIVSCAGEKLVPIKGPESEDGTQLNFAQFDDIPIPVGSTLDQQNSIIISKRILLDNCQEPIKLILSKSNVNLFMKLF